jgi:hypothetical protein
MWETPKRKVDSPVWKWLLDIRDRLIDLEGSLDSVRARLTTWEELPWFA